MLNEFKKFAFKGNVVELAVAVVVGAAFGKIISSFVADIIMPPISMMVSGVDISHLKWVIKEGKTTAQEISINYGRFIQTVVDFLIISLSVFFLVKVLKRFKEKEEEKKAEISSEPSNQEKILTEIRDILKSNNGD